MTTRPLILAAFLAHALQAAPPAPGSLLPGGAAAWKLAWSEEFDGPDAKLEERWQSQNSGSTHILSSRWRENAVVSNGTLKLLNKKEKRGGNDWTSGNIWTRKKFQYGYFECRYRYAAAEATNNSFWIMPTDKAPPGKKHFEIDINEGHFPNEINTNIHNHSDHFQKNGRWTHPTSSKSFAFGVRPDVTIQLENPVSTRRVRLTSTHRSHFHLGEFRIYNANAAGYPDPFSKSADTDKPGLVNFARETGTTIRASGSHKSGSDTSRLVADGDPVRRWVSQIDGAKSLEFTFPAERVVGCVQFLNGWPDKGSWQGMMDNYRVEYHDGGKWVELAKFDLVDGRYNFARDFHTYGLHWTEKELVFYFNGKELRREKNEFCHSPAPVWLSLAIIGWGGKISDAIDGTAMEVDHVRIYQAR
ncbi:MAG: glycosyl hydrolase family protein [Verrucomicrobia bacterium]|nr:MAG: glycosyl hydrolase family protein [Verrucomicrobiota bacterium]TAE88014.1 MAG: glycosyl hydrolase family protein [Verrucomicrobiota bacterium]TAF26237.1 MAG: glycosyl hydrolase family protein [Verrucomicrobiota bacterium]TAF41792.1 MAG: glycosyl hydrolase family protein [Verrucomicrobiota bacterium]